MFEFRLPDLGEGIHEGELLLWHVNRGDPIKEDEPLCDMETDKAAVTIPSPRTGTVVHLGAQPGDTVEVGAVLVTIDDGSGTAAEPVEPAAAEPAGPRAPAEAPAVRPEAAGPRAVAAPAVRRLAREMGIDINQVTGTGPGGRVTREDLAAFGSAQPASPEPVTTPEQPSPVRAAADIPGIPFLSVDGLPDYAAQGPVEIEPMRSLRKKTAVKTTSAAIIVPHVAHMDDIDVTDLEEMRSTYNEKQGSEGRLTLLAFAVKAVASLLKTYTEFNSSVDPHGMEMVKKKFFHIGFAADTPRGLMVPVVRDADRRSLAELGYRIRALAGKARDSQITIEELTGSTFTVTNVGAIGGTRVFPIINYPESAILGMGRVEKKPVVQEDAVVIRKILPVTLCFDHRVADGARAARFVRDLKAMLEDPVTFMARI